MFSFVGKSLRIAAAAAAALVLVAGAAMARSNAGTEPGRIVIEVNKSTQRMTVTVDGEKRYTFKVSTGKTGHTTPSGSFRVLSMKEMHYSRKYDNAPMPNALFFTSVGHAIHATTAVRNLGRPASHGCIRLSPKDAKTLYDLVERTGMRSVKVQIS
jgi:lipoprotein-anchoring transpeptidase ErfK/SrfK